MPGPTSSRSSCGSSCCTIPNLPADDCPDGAGEDDNVVAAGRAVRPRLLRRAPAGAALGDRRAARHPRPRAGGEAVRLDVRHVPKAGRGAGAGPVPARARPQRRPVRGDPAAHAGADRDDDLDRAPPEVRGRGLPHRAGRPLGHPDRRGAAHVARPRRDLRRGRPAAAVHAPTRRCFRREAGSAGKDTRGLLRVHEFDKVELLAYATPDQAADLHAEILARAEALLAELGLAYRVLDLCTGDIGNSAARTFDIEVYAPGVDRWLEVSSVSWFRDYQARRANIRYRPTDGKGTAILHTLNGSALAVPRVWAALVETYRQPDGTIEIPEALQPYMRGATTIRARIAPHG